MMEPRPREKIQTWKKKSKRRLSKFVSKMRRVSPQQMKKIRPADTYTTNDVANTRENLRTNNNSNDSILAPTEDYSIYNNKISTANTHSRNNHDNINSSSSEDEEEEEELLSVEDFVLSFRENSSEQLNKVYLTNHPIHKEYNSGVLTTSLCEDVFTLINLQIDVLHYYIVCADLLETPTGDLILIDNLSFLLKNLWYKQRQYRLMIGGDELEAMCAKSNDFLRMSERMEDIFMTLQERYPHLPWDDNDDNGVGTVITTNNVQPDASPQSSNSHARMKELAIPQQISNLLSLFSTDAVDAAQYVHVYVYRVVNASNIRSDLFSREWEELLTHNQIALSLVATLEDFMADIANFLCNDFLYTKAVDALVRATICFYVRCLIQKADSVRHRRRRRNTSVDSYLPFNSAERALTRMMYDIQILQTYFGGLGKEIAALQRVVERELSVLVTIHECMSIATGKSSGESLEDFILVLHKCTGCNSYVTKCLMKDLWFLMTPSTASSTTTTQVISENILSNKIDSMQEELNFLSDNMEKARLDIDSSCSSSQKNRDKTTTGLKLDETLNEMYESRLFQQHNPCAPIIKTLQQHGTPMLKALQDSLQQHAINFNSSIVNNTRNTTNIECRNDNETEPLQKQQSQRWDSTNLPWENDEEVQVKEYQPLQSTFQWEVIDHKEQMKNIQENLLGLLKLHNLKRWKPTKSSLVEV